MKFPDQLDLGTVTIEGVGEYRIYGQRVRRGCLFCNSEEREGPCLAEEFPGRECMADHPDAVAAEADA